MSSNFLQVRHSQWNSSPSKYMFTFAKAKRFQKPKLPNCEKCFYDIHSDSQKVCSFGKSNRFFNVSASHTPTKFYSIPSEFSKQPKGKMFSFGKNWKIYEKVYNEINPNKDLSIPGPGTYTPKYFSNMPMISLKPKAKNNLLLSNSANPGPGNYDIDSTFIDPGSQVNSKYNSSTTTKFNKEQRFKFVHKKEPGPGQYNPLVNMNKLGIYSVSNFKSSQVHSFGKLRRETIQIDRGRIETPGPGIYALPSEFGERESHNNSICIIKPKERAKTAAANIFNSRHTSTPGNKPVKLLDPAPIATVH